MKENGVIYDSTKEGIINQLSAIQRLESEGISCSDLNQSLWDKLMDVIENEDEKKLSDARDKLASLLPKNDS